MITLILSLLLSMPSAHAAGKKNCKLTIRTLTREGKAKIEVVEIHASSREECKFQAKEKEAIKDDEEIANVRVSYSWRELQD
jgi:hypothetical protein